MPGPRRSREPKNPLSCHDRALGLLAVRSRSRRELRSRLLRAGFDEAEVDDVLVRLEAVGLVDDQAFARDYVVHSLSVRRAGRRAMTSALFAKGIDRDTIERTIQELDTGDEEARALELARERSARLRGLDRQAAFRRLVSFLCRRGYDPSVARRAARVALEVGAAEG